MPEDDRERHINLQTTPEVMAGHYANFANVSHSDYEFSITFARVDHEVEDDRRLGAIMHASTEAEATGKRMLVVALDGPVRRLLEITNLTGRFRVYPSRDDALAAASA